MYLEQLRKHDKELIINTLYKETEECLKINTLLVDAMRQERAIKDILIGWRK